MPNISVLVRNKRLVLFDKQTDILCVYNTYILIILYIYISTIPFILNIIKNDCSDLKLFYNNESISLKSTFKALSRLKNNNINLTLFPFKH